MRFDHDISETIRSALALSEFALPQEGAANEGESGVPGVEK